ncbi:hypothetical protein O181_023468 [Austropuccinia psidii MF-1]|uniref:Uncharacterized protein n=1 Tax=Austropuccinia psidii MF-1 TaxID=1389203 RepID=A0A9Q3CH45_9BASI|nr:hypothetical protein [Austropuccinia psidii MF-1]
MKFHSNLIPSTPRSFQAFLSTLPSSIPCPSHKPSTSRPALAPPMKPSPIPQPRPSPIPTSHQLQDDARNSKKTETWYPLNIPHCSSISKSGALANKGVSFRGIFIYPKDHKE